MSLTKLATTLTVIFVISIVALITQLLFVLWRNHVFRRQTLPTTTVNDGNDHLHSGTTESPSAVVSSSKEQLLFFLCLRTQPQIDFAGAPTGDQNSSSPNDQMIDVLKVLGGFHGPSRVLCTIKEEEREGIESDDSAKKSKRVRLQACFEVAANGEAAVVEEEVAITVAEEEGEVDETTPYSTPCASPLYFTPFASPAHEFEASTYLLNESV